MKERENLADLSSLPGPEPISFPWERVIFFANPGPSSEKIRITTFSSVVKRYTSSSDFKNAYSELTRGFYGSDFRMANKWLLKKGIVDIKAGVAALPEYLKSGDRENAKPWRPKTVDRKISSFSGLVKFVEKKKLVEKGAVDAFREAVKDIIAIRSEEGFGQEKRKLLSSRQLKKLYAYALNDPSPAGRRNAAILGIMIETGAGPNEICALNNSDVEEFGDKPYARVTFAGKKNARKKRFFDLSVDVSPSVLNFARSRPEGEALFTRDRDIEKQGAQHLTRAGLWFIIKKIGEAVKINDLCAEDIEFSVIVNYVRGNSGQPLAKIGKRFGRNAHAVREILGRAA